MRSRRKCIYTIVLRSCGAANEALVPAGKGFETRAPRILRAVVLRRSL